MQANVAPPARLVSVDVLRGLTIALMILVNDPGDWAHLYSQLDHSPWNGFTLTDFVFPNFLFLVGISVILSMRARLARAAGVLTTATRRAIALRAVRRAALLIAIKLFLEAYPHFQLTHLRLFGVLTRIAFCYLAAAFLCLYTQRARTLAAVTAALLIGYWVLMRFVPVPGLAVASWRDAIPTHAIPLLDPERNLAAVLDRAFNAWTQLHLHTGALYNRTHDPEGLLSTLPAIATTLIGCLAGLLLSPTPAANPHPEPNPPTSPALVSPPAPQRRTTPLLLAAAGLASLAAGLVWNLTFPINKNLWTSSYVLFAAGWSLLLLALCHWLFDLRRIQDTAIGRPLTLPWLIYGSNAITVFVLSELAVETLIAIPIAHSAPLNPGVPPLTAWSWPYWHIFAAHGSTPGTSVAFAATFTALCLLPNYLLWSRRIFLRL